MNTALRQDVITLSESGRLSECRVGGPAGRPSMTESEARAHVTANYPECAYVSHRAGDTYDWPEAR